MVVSNGAIIPKISHLPPLGHGRVLTAQCIRELIIGVKWVIHPIRQIRIVRISTIIRGVWSIPLLTVVYI